MVKRADRISVSANKPRTIKSLEQNFLASESFLERLKKRSSIFDVITVQIYQPSKWKVISRQSWNIGETTG